MLTLLIPRSYTKKTGPELMCCIYNFYSKVKRKGSLEFFFFGIESLSKYLFSKLALFNILNNRSIDWSINYHNFEEVKECKQYYGYCCHKVIQKDLWFLLVAKWLVLLILLWFVAYMHNRRKCKFQLEVCENKDVIFSIQLCDCLPSPSSTWGLPGLCGLC